MTDKKDDRPIIRQDYLQALITELIRLRKIQGLSQEAVNYKLGVADRLVGKWECGIRNPTLFNLHCWAKALGAKLTIACNDNYKPMCQQIKRR